MDFQLGKRLGNLGGVALRSLTLPKVAQVSESDDGRTGNRRDFLTDFADTLFAQNQYQEQH